MEKHKSSSSTVSWEKLKRTLPPLLALVFLCSLRTHAIALPDSLTQALAQCSADSVCLRLQLELCDFAVFADPSESEGICHEALQMSQQQGDTLALARAYNYVGIVATLQARYITAVEYYQEGLKYYEALDDKKGVSKLLNNIGVIYSTQGNYQESIRYFSESLDLNIEIGDNHGAALNLHNTSSDYMMLEEIEQARFWADSLTRFQAVHGQLTSPYRLLGELFTIEEQLDSAEHYLLRALDFNREMNESHQTAGIYLSLAEINRKKRRFDQAMSYLQRAETLSAKNRMMEEMVSAFEIKSSILRDQGRFQEALDALAHYIEQKDSLEELNNFNTISELNARFDSERREKELAEKEALLIQRESSERMQRRIFILVTGFIAIVLILVTNSLVRKKRMNKLLNLQNEEIKEQRQKIISSINYAKKIQKAMLLPEFKIKKYLPDSFIYFRPKDIVSGDFYWFAQIENKLYIATIDCTGHGVPGAFMSLIANSKLNKVVLEMGLRDPGKILNRVHEEILQSLNQNNKLSETQDGMDMSLCVIGEKGDAIRFAGARTPVMMVSGDDAREFKADNLSIGGTFFRDVHAGSNGFTTREIPYSQGAALFLFTDGYMDQFGGELGKKLNKQRFRDILTRLSQTGFDKAKEELDQEFTRWRGSNQQIDDVLIIGMKLA